MKIYDHLTSYCNLHNVTLVAVSKTKPTSAIAEMYQLGQRVFGENRVQELVEKENVLPNDIEWHMIGHLQTKKVKSIIPFISLIHSGDRTSLLIEINKQAAKTDEIIDVLIQVKVAKEESKHGWDIKELLEQVSLFQESYPNIRFRGIMAMATFTEDESVLAQEFEKAKNIFDILRENNYFDSNFDILSMGMSGDYKLAIASGSSMIRVGSLLFGAR